MLPITNTLKVLDDVQKVVLDSAGLFKGGFSLFSVGKILHVVHDIKDIVTSAHAAFPELKDIDETEAQQLSAKAYEVVKAIIAGVSASK